MGFTSESVSEFERSTLAELGPPRPASVRNVINAGLPLTSLHKTGGARNPNFDTAQLQSNLSWISGLIYLHTIENTDNPIGTKSKPALDLRFDIRLLFGFLGVLWLIALGDSF